MDYSNKTKTGYGYLRVAAAVPRVNVADVDFNLKNILEMIGKAHEQGVDLIVFPELSITGYTCGDLFHNSTLLHEAEDALRRISDETSGTNMAVVVGAPVMRGNELFNCAVFIHNGKIKGYVPKTYLPNYKEFYELFHKAYVRPSAVPLQEKLDNENAKLDNLIKSNKDKFTKKDVDIWLKHGIIHLGVIHLDEEKDDDLSASNELIGKHANLMRLIQQQSKSCIAAYVYASAGYGESSTDLVFGGNAIIAENGNILCEGDRFSREPQLQVMDIDIEALNNERRVSTSFMDCRDMASEPCEPVSTMFDIYSDPYFCCMELQELELLHPVKRMPFVPTDKDDLDSRCEEIISIQALGLMRRLEHTHINHLVVGISGGLDSTLALLVAVEAFDRLGISIVPAVEQHFKDLEHDKNVHDVTYENSQARERTQILMDYANKVNALVLGTGDLSEIALGWCTYNGDHMSMYNVNGSIPKTLVRHLVRWMAGKAAASGDKTTSDTLLDVLDTPISPELTPAENGEIKQKTEDLVGPYELHDFFLYNMIRHNFGPRKIFLLAQKAFAGNYDDETIKKWLTTFTRRFFNQQFKRSCSVDGPKVGSVSLSPRGDWRMPSDASSALWLKECEALNKPLESYEDTDDEGLPF